MYGFKYAPSETKESDWSNLYHLLPKWTAQAERLLEIIGSPYSEEKPLLNPNDKYENVKFIDFVCKNLLQFKVFITKSLHLCYF